MDKTNTTLLIVEDEEMVLNQIKIILEDYVDTIYTAKNAKKAIDIIKNKKIDILLTDLLMPVMDGIELLEYIRDNNLDVPTRIITTAHTETEYLLSAIELKVDGYLLKPINPSDMVDMINKYIDANNQKYEIWLKTRILDSITSFVGGKKIEIIKYIFEHADSENIYNGSYQDIMDALNISKPTVVSLFKQMQDVGIITKIKNTVYKINTPN
jgi:YesN/AraC family two-component response regulator